MPHTVQPTEKNKYSLTIAIEILFTYVLLNKIMSKIRINRRKEVEIDRIKNKKNALASKGDFFR